MLVKRRHTVLWCRHSCSQIVPHILTIPYLYICRQFELNDVTVSNAEILQHRTSCHNLWGEGRAHLQGFEEDGAPACLHHAKCSFNGTPSL